MLCKDCIEREWKALVSADKCFQKNPHPSKKKTVRLFFPPHYSFLSHNTKLSDKVGGGILHDLTQRQASCTVPWKKKQGKTLHKSAGSARIKKYLDKQLVIWKAKFLAPAQKSNYSHLGTQNVKRGYSLKWHEKFFHSLTVFHSCIGWVHQVVFKLMAKRLRL